MSFKGGISLCPDKIQNRRYERQSIAISLSIWRSVAELCPYYNSRRLPCPRPQQIRTQTTLWVRAGHSDDSRNLKKCYWELSLGFVYLGLMWNTRDLSFTTERQARILQVTRTRSQNNLLLQPFPSDCGLHIDRMAYIPELSI